MFETIKYNLDDRVATISLNRPESYNAFNKAMRGELLLAIKKAKNDEAVRVIVITGEGKAFCSGQDLNEVEDNDFKHGKFLPGMKIPITSKESIKEKPDYALVLAWNFIDEIKKNNTDLAHKFISIKDLEI